MGPEGYGPNCPECGNPWETHGFSTRGLLWSRASTESRGLVGCHLLKLLLGPMPEPSYRGLPRVAVTVKRVRQKSYFRVVESRCSECGEGSSVPEGSFAGKTVRQIVAELRAWAYQHRLEHRPGGRKNPAPSLPPGYSIR